MSFSLTSRILRHAADSGIDLVGITSIEPFARNGKIIDPTASRPGKGIPAAVAISA